LGVLINYLASKVDLISGIKKPSQIQVHKNMMIIHCRKKLPEMQLVTYDKNLDENKQYFETFE